MRRASIVAGAIDPASLIDEVSSTQYGAISLFVGTVREVNEGRSVSGIEYSAYKSMASAELERILDEALRLIEPTDQPGIRKLVVELESQVEESRGER